MYIKKGHKSGEKRKNAIGQTLEIVEILVNNGIDISKIKISKKIDNKQTMLKLKHIPGLEQIILDNDLDEEYPIGQRIADLRRTVRGTGSCSITKEQLEKIKKLGLMDKRSKKTSENEEKIRKTKVNETLDILEILDRSGINITKILLFKVKKGKAVSAKLKDILGISKILEEYSLDPEYPIGMRITNLKQAMKGKRPPKLTSEQIERAMKLKLIEIKRGNVVDEIINVLNLLKIHGISLQGIQIKKRENGKLYYKKLKDISNTEQIIKKYDLDGEMLIGARIEKLIRSVKGIGPYKLTQAQIEEIENLNLYIEKVKRKRPVEDALVLKRKTQITEFLKILKVLVDNNIEISFRSLYKLKNGKKDALLLKDIPGMEEIIKRENLDENFPIDEGVKSLRKAIRKNDGSITPEQIDQFLRLTSISKLERKANEKRIAKKRKEQAAELYEEYKQVEQKREVNKE